MVIQFVELNCLLGSENVYSPTQAAPCHALEGRNDALREREVSISAEMLTAGLAALWWEAKPGPPLLSLTRYRLDLPVGV